VKLEVSRIVLMSITSLGKTGGELFLIAVISLSISWWIIL